ncbi:MAG: glutamate 5-kinase [Sphaerospermopsis sp. SIO1G2]|nr:glutamate 5-kinase [Sphaerospermopsis sp. SIO1G2]
MDVIENAQRIVVKVGSALVAKPDTGRVNHYWLAGLAKDIALLRAMGKQVCVVSSGAVTLGRDLLGMDRESMQQSDKQAAAACGQMVQMRAWQEVFVEDEISVAQVLLTIDDSEERKRYLNARNTLDTLLTHGVVPIVNENDTVATTGIRVGDNDRLAARVAQMIGADALILLSDVDGMYSADPTKHPDAEFIDVIDEITDDIRQQAAPTTTMTGTGGMITKVMAASIATASGCHTVIACGTDHTPITRLLHGHNRYTVFTAQTSPMTARKEWIAGALSPSGTLYADTGALNALAQGNSLLPVGITAIEGMFHRGDAVLICAESSREPYAKGLVCYHSDELVQIIGRQSTHIADILGYERGDVVVHRDDMVIM